MDGQHHVQRRLEPLLEPACKLCLVEIHNHVLTQKVPTESFRGQHRRRYPHRTSLRKLCRIGWRARDSRLCTHNHNLFGRSFRTQRYARVLTEQVPASIRVDGPLQLNPYNVAETTDLFGLQDPAAQTFRPSLQQRLRITYAMQRFLKNDRAGMPFKELYLHRK